MRRRHWLSDITKESDKDHITEYKKLSGISIPAELFHICSLSQFFPVGSNDFLVPVEGIFFASFQCSVAFVIAVDVDEAVALLHFAGREGYAVDAAPWRVAHQIDAVLFDSFFHFFDMRLEVVDAVWIVAAAVLFLDVDGAEAVFDDE